MQSLFENHEQAKLPSWTRFLPMVVMAIIVACGVIITARAHTRTKAEWQAKERAQAERTVLRETEIRLSALKSEITLADQKRLDILKDRKPRKVAGIDIPRPLLPEQQKRYDAAADRLAELRAAYRKAAETFNERLKAYTGLWPDDEPSKPTPIPFPEGQ